MEVVAGGWRGDGEKGKNWTFMDLEQDVLKGFSNLPFAPFPFRITCSYGPGLRIMKFFLINIFSLGL